MKLHLPSGLRRALLACLAALTLPTASIPTTIVSASGIASAFAALSAISAFQARAQQEYTWSDADGSHTETFSGTVFSRMDSAEVNNPGNSGNSGLGTLELADTSNDNSPVGEGTPSLGKFWNTNDNVLTNTLQIKKLEAETGEVNIKCDWSGNFRLGGLIVDASDVSYRIGRQVGYTDVNGFQAIIFQAEDGQTVKMYIGSITNLVGRSVAVNSNSDWKIAKGKTLQFTGNTNGAFTIGENVSVDLSSYGATGSRASVSVEMGLTVSSGGGLTVGDGVDLNVTGALNLNGENANLTVESGASLSLVVSSTGAGTLTLNGGTLESRSADEAGLQIAKLKVSGESSITGAKFTLTDLTVGEGAKLKIVSGQEGSVSRLAGAGSVEVSGEGTILNAQADGGGFTGTLSAVSGGKIVVAGDMGGATLEVGDGGVLSFGESDSDVAVTLKGGCIEGIEHLKGAVTLQAGAGGVNLEGGLDAGQVQHIGGGAASCGQVTGLKEGTTLTFHGGDSITLGAAHVTSSGTGTYLLQFENGNGTVVIDDSASFTINIESSVARGMSGEYVLWISNGAIDEQILQSLIDERRIQFGAELADMVCKLKPGAGGKFCLTLTGDTSGAWFASKEGDINAADWDKNYQSKPWKSIVVDQNMRVELDPKTLGEGKVTLAHLKGDGGKTLSLSNGGEGTLIVELNNGDFASESHADPNTVMNGNITAGSGVEVHKTGENSLTVNGNLTTAGKVDVQEGSLVLNGNANSVGELGLQEGAVLSIGGRTTLSGKDSTLAGGTLSGAGTLVLGRALDASAANLDSSLIVHLNGANAKLTTGENARLGALNGKQGMLELGGALTLQGEKEGSFSGSLEGEGTLTVTGGSKQTLTGAGNEKIALVVGTDAKLRAASPSDTGTLTLITGPDGASYKSLIVGTGSTLNVQTGVGGAGTVSVGEEGIIFAAGSVTNFTIDFDGLNGGDPGKIKTPLLETGGTVTVEKGAKMNISYAGSSTSLAPGEALDLWLVKGGEMEGNMSDVEITIASIYKLYYINPQVEFVDGGIRLTGAPQKGNPLITVAGDDENTISGASLLYGARYSAQASNPNGDLSRTLEYVMENLQSNPAEVRRVMSSVAGSTVTAIGAAQHDGMRHQLMRVRNHSDSLGLAPGYQYDDMPYWHAWLEGTSVYSRLKTDGSRSGYKHVAWGGSFGVDADVTERTSLGLSATALYGDLDAKASDTATGHLDSYYLSGIMRTQVRRWGHTLAVAGGIDRAKLDRTVDYGAGVFQTKGTTHGWSLGASYEITYDVPMDEERTNVFQPLVNVSYVRSFMKGYDESGESDMNLRTNDQVWDTVTVGLGARWIGSLSETAVERSVLFELSAMMTQDMGDRQGVADVSLAADPGNAQRVRGAEYGRTAVQAGVALRVPISEQAMLYLNTDAEFRQRNTAWQATVGMRYDF